MLDDWKDYRHFKNTDRGDDFAILRDILRDAIQEKDKKDGKTARHESYDSGYFSRRESDLGEQPAIRTPESASEVKFVLVAEGTPAAESETSTLHLGLDGALDGKDILNGVAFSAQNAFEITDSSGASQEIEPIAPEDTWSTCASECSTRVVKTAYRFLE